MKFWLTWLILQSFGPRLWSWHLLHSFLPNQISDICLGGEDWFLGIPDRLIDSSCFCISPTTRPWQDLRKKDRTMFYYLDVCFGKAFGRHILFWGDIFKPEWEAYFVLGERVLFGSCNYRIDPLGIVVAVVVSFV